eukprot:COSAG04_NODE_6418_length_1331_cov_2.172078_3_plen_49_part_00
MHLSKAKMAALRAPVLVLLTAQQVSSHGHMTSPPSRNGGTLAKAADCL